MIGPRQWLYVATYKQKKKNRNSQTPHHLSLCDDGGTVNMPHQSVIHFSKSVSQSVSRSGQ